MVRCCIGHGQQRRRCGRTESGSAVAKTALVNTREPTASAASQSEKGPADPTAQLEAGVWRKLPGRRRKGVEYPRARKVSECRRVGPT